MLQSSQFDLPRVTSNQNSMLISRFSEVEIKMALKALGKCKALGSDGFTVEFFLQFWDLVKEDFQALFEQIYVNGRLNVCIQENFICLIKKLLYMSKTLGQ